MTARPGPPPGGAAQAERAFGGSIRRAITLAEPHCVHRSRFTKLATGASDLMPCDLRSDGATT
jgi:hypothetical protein